jgi:hypothetical protein
MLMEILILQQNFALDCAFRDSTQSYCVPVPLLPVKHWTNIINSGGEYRHTF